MPAKTKIEWADYISNPIKARFEGKQGHACVKISEGCAHCWASTFNVRLGTGLEYTVPNLDKVDLYLDDQELNRLITFKPRGPFKNGRDRALVFMFDMTDAFGNWVDPYWVSRCFAMFEARKDVDFLVLTKRPDLMMLYCVMKYDYGEALHNVYLGTSIENQARADERVDVMSDISDRGWNTVVSYEPALEAVDWRSWWWLDGLICGGESGHGARPMPIGAARVARDFCQAHDIPFFFKQWGEYAPLSHLPWITDKTTFAHRPVEVDGEMMVRLGKGLAGHVLDGREWREMP